MKHKRVVSCALTVVCLLQITAAMSKTDFSGAWVLDKNRSFSNPAGLEQTLNVVHTGDQIKLDTKVVTARGEQAIIETYTLDGKETSFTPSGGQPGAKGKRTAA